MADSQTSSPPVARVTVSVIGSKHCQILALVAVMTCVAAVIVASVGTARQTPHQITLVGDYAQAAQFAVSGHCDKSIYLYLHALQVDGPSVNAFNGLAGCYSTLGQPVAAISEYDKAIALDPMNFGIFLSRANVESGEGITRTAIRDSATALRLAPHQVPSYLSIADSFASSQDPSDALRVVDEAIRLVPTNPILYEKRAGIYLSMHNLSRTYGDYAVAMGVASTPHMQSTIHADFAGVFDQQGQYKSALHEIGAALRLEPQRVAYYMQQGNIYRDAGIYASAFKAYGHALNIAPSGPSAEAANETMGDVYVSLNDIKHAIPAYRAALLLTADPLVVAKLKLKLSALTKPNA